MEGMPQKNYPRVYLLVGQVSWPNDLQFKRYIQKCILPPVLIPIITSRPLKLMEWYIEYLKNGTWLFHEIKKPFE